MFNLYIQLFICAHTNVYLIISEMIVFKNIIYSMKKSIIFEIFPQKYIHDYCCYFFFRKKKVKSDFTNIKTTLVFRVFSSNLSFIYICISKIKNKVIISSHSGYQKLFVRLYIFVKKNCVTAIYFIVISDRDDLNRFPPVHDLLIGGILQSDFRWAPPMGGFANNPDVHTYHVYPTYVYTYRDHF